MSVRPLGSRRRGGESYLLITVATFAITVVAVRWFLEMTGYPKVGGGGLHVAHMLWGGLLLVVGALVPLLFVGRRSLWLSAIATGIGVGLFIDEVGKFITETNDYFFAPAAPLIYGALLLLLLLWLLVRRGRAHAPGDVLQDGVEALRVAVDGQLTRTERDRVVRQLDQLCQTGPAREAGMAGSIRESLTAPEMETSLRPEGWLERGEARALWERVMPLRLERIVVLIGLAWNALLGLVSSLVLLAALDIGGLEDIPDPEGPVEVPSDPVWVLLMIAIGVVVGVLSTVAIVLMLRGRERRGTTVAIGAMLTSLVAGGLLTFYIAQFGAVASTFVHLALLGLLLDARERLRGVDDDNAAASDEALDYRPTPT